VIGPIQSGEQAIEAALAHGPDAIIMDIRLKGAIDGFQAAEVFRDRLRTPIIFCRPTRTRRLSAAWSGLATPAYTWKPTASEVLRLALLAVADELLPRAAPNAVRALSTERSARRHAELSPPRFDPPEASHPDARRSTRAGCRTPT
jgi:DNA-binding NarL/FixJ family response regulator